MSETINSALQFHIHELKIVTKVGKTDISGMMEEMCIFDSVYKPVVDGYVDIIDSISMSSKLHFDGSEKIIIKISKTKDNPDFIDFSRSFRIYKQSDKIIVNHSTERYRLHFISEEFVTSNLQTLSHSYNGTYSDAAYSVMINNLNIPTNYIASFSPSLGVRNIVFPGYKPIEAIQYCARYALDAFDEKPNFLFFENKFGYNFISLNELSIQKSIGKIRYEPKNIVSKEDGSVISDFWSARYLKSIQNYNYLKGIVQGHFAATVRSFDPITGSINSFVSKPENYLVTTIGGQKANFAKISNRLGETSFDMSESKVVSLISSTSTELSEYIKKKDPAFLQKIEPEEKIHLLRGQIFDHLESKKLKIVLPGNFNITSGLIVDVEVPYFGEKSASGDNVDVNLSGKYLIMAVRQIITYSKHETVFEVATNSLHEDSTNYASTSEQNEEYDP